MLHITRHDLAAVLDIGPNYASFLLKGVPFKCDAGRGPVRRFNFAVALTAVKRKDRPLAPLLLDRAQPSNTMWSDISDADAQRVANWVEAEAITRGRLAYVRKEFVNSLVAQTKSSAFFNGLGRTINHLCCSPFVLPFILTGNEMTLPNWAAGFSKSFFIVNAAEPETYQLAA